MIINGMIIRGARWYFAQTTYFARKLERFGCVVPRLELSDFTIGHHSTIVKKKIRNLICLPCFFFSSPPYLHTRRSSVWVWHHVPSSGNRPMLFPLNLLSFPLAAHTFPLFLKAKLLPSSGFRKFSRFPLFAPRVFLCPRARIFRWSNR